MANQIRIQTSVQVVQDVGGSAGAQSGITYTNKQLDGNSSSRLEYNNGCNRINGKRNI